MVAVVRTVWASGTTISGVDDVNEVLCNERNGDVSFIVVRAHVQVGREGQENLVTICHLTQGGQDFPGRELQDEVHIPVGGFAAAVSGAGHILERPP